MKVSIITAVRDGEKTVAQAMASLFSQRHPEVEVIVIDGASRDGTLAALAPFRSRIAHLVSEPDRGVWEAMNKGVALASGEVVGFLNADDRYADADALGEVVACFSRHGVEVVFGDVRILASDRGMGRLYRGRGFVPERLAWGLMPPHPAFFVRREVFRRCGPFRTDYRIAADFEWMVRLFIGLGVSMHYLPRVLVEMRAGGLSNRGWSSAAIITREMVRACRENGVRSHPLMILSRLPRKFVTQVLGWGEE